MWCKESKRYFAGSKILLTEKLTNGALLTPTPGVPSTQPHRRARAPMRQTLHVHQNGRLRREPTQCSVECTWSHDQAHDHSSAKWRQWQAVKWTSRAILLFTQKFQPGTSTQCLQVMPMNQVWGAETGDFSTWSSLASHSCLSSQHSRLAQWWRWVCWGCRMQGRVYPPFAEGRVGVGGGGGGVRVG